MRSLLAAILFVNAIAAAHAELNAWKFRVLLDDREIGRHEFVLQGAGEERELRSVARFDVRFLFVNVYRYRHEAVERLNGDCLQSLVSRTETNGERQSVRAAVRGNQLVVERPESRDAYKGCVMSFAYWNPQILNANALLNSQTGELLPVKVASQGEETIEVRGQPVTAQRHRLSTPQLSIDLWYAGDEWVALESPAKGGRRLRYELL
jgi:hypothetical protein